MVAHAPALPAREVVRRFWPDARPFRRWLPLALALIAAGVAVETAEIFLFKLVVDDVLVPGELGPLLWIGAACVGLLLLGGAIALADDLLNTWLGERFLLAMRQRVFGHLLTLSPDALDRRRLGDVLTRLGGDVAAIESFVLSGVASAFAAVLQIVFFVGALLLPAVGPRADLADRRAALLRRRPPLLRPDQARVAREAPPLGLARRGGRADARQRRARAGLAARGRRARALPRARARA